MKKPVPHRRAFLCRKGFGSALVDELRRTFPDGTHRFELEGAVVSTLSEADAARVVSIAFAEQVMPNLVDVKTPSIPRWGEVLAPRVEASVETSRWRALVAHTDPDAPDAAELVHTVENALREALPAALWKARVQHLADRPSDDERYVQVLITGPRTGLFSVATPEDRATLRRNLSRFPAGRVHTAEDAEAPSRAFMKVLQAELQLGRALKAGETAVDLGASPGGWSWVALRRGLTVTAVDRSPLREDLMAHPGLHFVRGDAFKWRPKEPVDWLLCDVISYPQRTVELLKGWLGARLCRRLIVSVKFKGDADYPLIDDVKKVLKSNSREWCIRHLPANRNEVCVIAECAQPEGIWAPALPADGAI